MEPSEKRRPRVLVVGQGEPDLASLCAALERRGIEPVLSPAALEESVRAERPNLVLLVGDAAEDDGERGIAIARRAGPTPVVVATDPEPLERRLAPFQLGASGVVVRRGDAEEMAGELQHLLAENARRAAERAPELSVGPALDVLAGLGSRDLRMSPTPHEGVSRRELSALLGRGREPQRSHVEDVRVVGEPAPLLQAPASLALTNELEASPPPSPPAATQAGAPSAEPLQAPSASRSSPGSSSPPPGAARGDRTSSSALLAVSPLSRPPVEDRASTLRAQALPRARASVAPALLGLVVLLAVVVALVAGR
jgi:DNA-binding NarL/FixJ family response regulator